MDICFHQQTLEAFPQANSSATSSVGEDRKACSQHIWTLLHRCRHEQERIRAAAVLKQKGKCHAAAVPRSSQQPGGNVMLLLKLHPCAVAARTRAWLPKGAAHNHPCGVSEQEVSGSAGGERVSPNTLAAREAAPRSRYPTGSTGTCVLPTHLPATTQPIHAMLHQQPSLDLVEHHRV